MQTNDCAVAPQPTNGATSNSGPELRFGPADVARDARIEVVAIELRQANEFVARHHRHHPPEVGHRFSIGVKNVESGLLCGVAIVGRPKARMIDQHRVVEVTRLVTDGTRNACSLLYASAARAAKAIGYDEIITYTLESEPGTSLRAVGWEEVRLVRAEEWSRPSRRRKPALVAPKRKWRRVLRGVLVSACVAREPEQWVLDAALQDLRSGANVGSHEPACVRRRRRGGVTGSAHVGAPPSSARDFRTAGRPLTSRQRPVVPDIIDTSGVRECSRARGRRSPCSRNRPIRVRDPSTRRM